ncbi:MAG: integrase core domain-containing protein [Bryobacteraceae bacterium]
MIERTVTAKPLWRAPRIHGELKMLGISISERTVSRILRRLPRPDVRLRVASLGIREVLPAPQSPWQNPYAERLIGSIRRECVNHFVILNAKHLKWTLALYFRYYHESRTHLALEKQCPFPRPVSSIGRIIQIPQLGGLHHRYERLAA